MVFFKNKVSAFVTPEVERGMRLNLEPVRPKRPKKATDAIMILAFFSCLAAIILLSYYGLTKGRPQIFINGVDSWGNVCGKQGNVLPSSMQTHLRNHVENRFEFHFKSIESDASSSVTDFLQQRTEDIVFCIKVSYVSAINPYEIWTVHISNFSGLFLPEKPVV